MFLKGSEKIILVDKTCIHPSYFSIQPESVNIKLCQRKVTLNVCDMHLLQSHTVDTALKQRQEIQRRLEGTSEIAETGLSCPDFYKQTTDLPIFQPLG